MYILVIRGNNIDNLVNKFPLEYGQRLLYKYNDIFVVSMHDKVKLTKKQEKFIKRNNLKFVIENTNEVSYVY